MHSKHLQAVLLTMCKFAAALIISIRSHPVTVRISGRRELGNHF
ncbi:hypothetical protein-transmembrane prediction [Rhodopirellula baltica SH 1]|uniref:Uncharacterized protein n=1 Tax=Rhodopirellula baltica (strain DSM 10527 / NCIMB 13988 / SH1) TaxID=243090 RepID=Q7UXQ2_RHOBA|nr:hypothetical protein-transmembrane prediction [Rhodopirellula baltica SH 1]